MQTPLHSVRPFPQTQLPFEHSRLAAHAFWQAPQCAALLPVSMHCPPQSVPPLHEQVPSWHAAPAGQTLPQVPQSRGSLLRFTHPPAQLVVGVAQLATH
jgi:hypothetical protein